MARYECLRQIECLLIIEADDEEDLKTKLLMSEDDLLEQADGVSFATPWQVQREDGTGEVFDVNDNDVADAIDSATPWTKD
jgi:hypothetical protein